MKGTVQIAGAQHNANYSDEEKRILRIAYSFFTRADSQTRNVANALKGYCRDEIGIIKQYYPYQAPDGRPIKKGRDKSTGKQIWKSSIITPPEATRILTKCLYAFIDAKYGKAPTIEVHELNSLVECDD